MSISTIVIPVAGKGTRFLPATKEIPKEMIPILKKPMIHYVVEEAVAAGVKKIIFITSEGKHSIENYFDRNLSLESFLISKNKNSELEQVRQIGDLIEVITVRQKEQLGLGHAILCAKDLIGNNNFGVILGDDLILSEVSAIKQLMNLSECVNDKSIVGVMEVEASQICKYGIIEGDEIDIKGAFKMTRMLEKPNLQDTNSRLATPGRYVLTSKIFDCLQKISLGSGGEYQLTDALNMLAEKDEVYAYKYVGDRFDTGTIEGYLDAVVDFALRDPNLKETMTEIIYKKQKKYQL